MHPRRGSAVTTYPDEDGVHHLVNDARITRKIGASRGTHT